MLSESPKDSLEGVKLCRPNLRKFINLLKKTRPGLTTPKIEEMAGLRRRRLDSLLNNKGLVNIRTQEIISLFKLYEKLEGRKNKN